MRLRKDFDRSVNALKEAIKCQFYEAVPYVIVAHVIGSEKIGIGFHGFGILHNDLKAQLVEMADAFGVLIESLVLYAYVCKDEHHYQEQYDRIERIIRSLE